MLLSHKRHFNKYEFYSPRGYLFDMKNKELLDFFTNELKKYIKIIVNLVEKQQEQIEKLNKSDASKEQSSMDYYNLYKELEDKIKAKIEENNKKCDECNFNKSGICKELKAYNCCSIQSVLELLKELGGTDK